MQKISAKTPYGTLIGCQFGKVVSFLGIPYAEPPVGARRFLPPAPRRAAPAPLLALETGSGPAQPTPRWGKLPLPPTSEDCLNLNLFTPGVDQARRPVLVHLFGGGFEGGNGSGGLQDGAALAERGDCVVVRLNFRVGALGFLYLGDVWGPPYQAGNPGLLDVVVALEWIQQNIRFLGGDPENITLFGISSGAFMIASLFGVPQSEGLFHKVWLQSGSASRILDRQVATRQAAEFLEIIGVKPGDTTALQRVPVARIIEAQSKVVFQDVGERNAPGGKTLGVVNDGHTLKEHPLAVIRRGDRHTIPILLGTTRDETRMWFVMGMMREKSPAEVRQEFERFAGPVRGPQLFEIYRAILPGASTDRLRERFLTDAIYRVPAVRTALAHNAAGGQAFVYRFDWASPFMQGQAGACHGLDEPFVWGITDPAQSELLADTPEARRISEEMTSALLQFAATGNPGWRSYTPDGPATRLFGATGEGGVLAEVDSAFLKAWDGVERR
jgi:para-nitrobenzyl esterase